MHSTQLLTQFPQWPSSGAPLRLPAPYWNPYHYHQYHNPAMMGKKGNSNPSSGAYVPPHIRQNRVQDDKPGAPSEHRAQQSQVSQQSQYNVSQLGVNELLTSWYGYGSDNINAQTGPAIPPNPYFTLPQNTGPQPQLPHQRPSQRWPAKQGAPMNLQAACQLPGSRYNPLQTRSQRRALHIPAADQIIPSIETPVPTTGQPPWRLPLRNVQSRPYSPRNSHSATPGPPDRPVTPPLAPSPSEAYLQRALKTPERLTEPKKLLVLLDLNGTLLYRPRMTEIGPNRGKREHILRPGTQKLIDYLFENHAVMVYTSATRRNAELCVDALLRHLTIEQRSKLIGIRPREQLGLNPAQQRAKVQVYKPLEPIWALNNVVANGKQNGCNWDETNTVLLDDTIEKAVGNPHSLLQVPEFKLPDGTKEHNMSAETRHIEKAIMEKVQTKLEELRWEVSVTRKIRQWRAKKETLADNSDEIDEQVMPKTHVDLSAPLDAEDEAVRMATAAYPTPESTGAGEDEADDVDDGGVRLKSPSPVTEKHFDFVDGSKRSE